MIHWMYVISHLAVAMNGVLVVTTKENISQNPRMFPSVVTYLVSHETMWFYRSLNVNINQVQLKHRYDGLFHIFRPSRLIYHEFHTLKLR